MASIVKRGARYSVVYYTYFDGKRSQKWDSFRSIGEAEQRKWQVELWASNQKRKGSDKVETVEQLISMNIRVYGCKRWSLSTFQSNCSLIKNYIVPFMGSVRLSELSPRTVAMLYERLLTLPKVVDHYGKCITVSTLKSIHKVLHSAFEQAVLWEFVLRNPFQKATIPKEFPKEQRFLTPEQVNCFLEKCKDEEVSLAVHLAFSGTLMKGELLALTGSDINFRQCCVSVSKTLKRVSASAATQLSNRDILYRFRSADWATKTFYVLKQPKTVSSIRTVHLPTSVLLKLQDRQGSRQKEIDADLDGVPQLIFAYQDKRPLQEKTLSERFSKQLAIIGLPSVTFHSLRHSSITYRLILSGGNIKAVQGDSGHAQAEMITEIYGKVLDASRREIAEKLENSFYGTLIRNRTFDLPLRSRNYGIVQNTAQYHTVSPNPHRDWIFGHFHFL